MAEAHKLSNYFAGLFSGLCAFARSSWGIPPMLAFLLPALAWAFDFFPSKESYGLGMIALATALAVLGYVLGAFEAQDRRLYFHGISSLLILASVALNFTDMATGQEGGWSDMNNRVKFLMLPYLAANVPAWLLCARFLKRKG